MMAKRDGFVSPTVEPALRVPAQTVGPPCRDANNLRMRHAEPLHGGEPNDLTAPIGDLIDLVRVLHLLLTGDIELVLILRDGNAVGLQQAFVG